MKVAVIGAGIVGVTTAHALAVDGHDVTVLERRGSVAAEGSFAHGGLLSTHPLRFGTPPTFRLGAMLGGGNSAWPWPAWRLRAGRTTTANRLRMQRLARFSLEQLHELTQRLRFDYEHASGHLLLWRSARDMGQADAHLAGLTELGIRFESLDAERCRHIEPGLSAETPLHGGLYFADDEVGNCRQFAHLLRGAAQRQGVRFRFHTDVSALHAGPKPQVVQIYNPPETATLVSTRSDAVPSDAPDTEPMPFAPITETFDAVVVCAALGAPALLAAHGLHVPLQAVHGHSITAPLRTSEMFPDQGPRAVVTDDHHRVSIARFGSRVRVAGSLQIGGSVDPSRDAAFDVLFKVLHDWFPGAARMSHVQRWKGAQAMLADGPPVLGASGIAGVWLNLGHGSDGWAMACGSACVLADTVAGRTPAIDTEGLGIERFTP